MAEETGPRRVAAVLLAFGLVPLAASACRSGVTQSVTTGPAAAQLVASSAQTTLSKRTADVEISGSIQVKDLTVPLTGNGQMDMEAPAFMMTAYANARGVSLTVEELMVHGAVDMAISSNGHTFADLTGKHWVQVPLDLSSGVDQLETGDPVSALRVLESQGAEVKTIGAQVINGVLATGYLVVPTKAAIVAGAERSIQTAGLTPDQIATLKQAMEQVPPPTFTIWIDKAQLARRMTMVMDLGGSSGGSGTISTDFIRYGVPVSITAPPPSDVSSYADFLKAAGQS